MQVATRVNIEFPKPYPRGRLAFFSQRYMSYVLRRGLAYDVGSDAIVLLLAVSSAEDRTRYQKPVGFWNDHLMSLTGLSRNRLFAARKKLTERGWLAYFAGAKGRAPVYFVTVPGGDALIDSSPLGESAADEVMLESAAVAAEVGPVAAVPPKPDCVPVEVAKSRVPEAPPSSDEPLRNELRKEIVELGVDCPNCLERAEQGLGLEGVAAVVRYARSRWVTLKDGRVLRPWGGGAVYSRLMASTAASRSVESGWAKADPEWEAAWKKAERSRQRAEDESKKQKEALEKKQAGEVEKNREVQLEFDWGWVIDLLAETDSGCERLFAALRGQSEQMEIWVRSVKACQRETWRLRPVRMSLLRLAAAGELVAGD